VAAPSVAAQPQKQSPQDFAAAAADAAKLEASATTGDTDTTASKPADPAAAAPQVALPQHAAAAQPAEATAAVTRAEQITAHPVVEQVAVRLIKAAADGINHINIALNPVELGHIEVRMEIGPNGHYKAVFAADRPQTADMLQRNAQELTRSLQDAGLRTDTGSLSFNLRGQGQQNSHPGNQQGQNGSHQNASAADIGPDVVLPPTAYAGSTGGTSRLDIRV
jgi:flagellar hook-length control protein FliK